MSISLKILVSGIVQGVGFRPFVYRTAKKAGVRGYVKNLGGSEVEIVIEGELNEITKFFEIFYKCLPPPALIEQVIVRRIPPKGFSSFEILKSARSSTVPSMVPPDFAICDDCLREILSKKDLRRFNYPFNSCAWCGPRFSMMYSVPYDRENTSMKFFPLCEKCLADYRDPENVRRFHAQGISCNICGIKLWLEDAQGEIIDTEDPVATAAKLINEGFIVAIKGIGGFHLASLASDDDVVLKLRKRKKRPQKPFAIMALNLDIASKLAHITPLGRKLLTSPSRPIVLLHKKDNAPVSEFVAPGLDTLGIMLPYTGLHYLILSHTSDHFLIMTSGNLHGKPICSKNVEARRKLRGIADYFLLHNREIVNRVDDSVIKVINDQAIFIRRSRGYAPMWIRLPVNANTTIIALGAELYNTGAITFENHAILTQHIGDLNEYENLIFLKKSLLKLLKMHNKTLDKHSILVLDMHPRYSNRLIAEEWKRKYNCRVIEVQHHFAHALSVIADNFLPCDRKYLAITIDGVGYGLDRCVWGGEVLLVDMSNGKLRGERLGHIRYFPLIGGDRAVTYPVRSLAGLLLECLSPNEAKTLLLRKRLAEKLPGGEHELMAIFKQYFAGMYVKTSSLGRLLDAFSTFLNICTMRTYEGEPAIKLEAAGERGRPLDDFQVKVGKVETEYIIDFKPLLLALLENEDKSKEDIARSIQEAIGKGFAEIALQCCKHHDVNVVCLSGGAAVNSIILSTLQRELSSHGIKLVVNRKVPCGDGGIALGQCLAASLILKGEGGLSAGPVQSRWEFVIGPH